MPGVIFRHESSLRHETGQHPERPARIVAIERELEARGWLGYERRESPAATAELLDAVHPAAYRASIEQACAGGGAMLDPDTVVSPGSYEAALHAAGGAAALVDVLLSGEARFGAALHRPPGHHAERARAMGFCLFNNVAVAARRALDAHGLERVLVLDWDVHHGNGTNDIFHAEPRVLFASIHEWPLYPGSGSAGDIGSGPGAGYTVNLPVPEGSGDAVFTALVDHVVVPAARTYRPQLILVSAGFDAHADDPLAGCEVSDAGYAAMAASVRALAADLDIPLGVVLEGGYDLGALSRSLAATLEAVGSEAVRPAPAAPHPLASAAAERVAALLPPT
ncbi:MAG TPA: histone deacetylase [Solirubrobacteraceae bacterium]|nr:histone deacetylase [Solirubrobacteraceae bacterium]